MSEIEVLDHGEIATAEKRESGDYLLMADLGGDKVRIIVNTEEAVKRLLFRRVMLILDPTCTPADSATE